MDTTPCRLSISTMSLGYSSAGHQLEHRLRTAQRFGYEGIELYYDDLEHLALDLADGSQASQNAKPASDEMLLRAAAIIRGMCDATGLTVICLQPLRHFEGLLDRHLFKSRLDQLRLWCRLAGVLKTNLILIPSNFLAADKVTTDFEAITQDLREAADLAASATPPVRLCYEALAWGTAVCTWQQSYDIVQRVDRANFGLCLDTFNIAARDYAEPVIATGDKQCGTLSMEQSLQSLVAIVDVSRIFLVQAADGALCQALLYRDTQVSDQNVPALPPLLSWSRNHRLFCGETEQGASMPTMDVLKAIYVDMGYRGWLSHELFNEHFADTDPRIPSQMAQRGLQSWKKIVQALQLPMDRKIKARPVVSLPALPTSATLSA